MGDGALFEDALLGDDALFGDGSIRLLRGRLGDPRFGAVDLTRGGRFFVPGGLACGRCAKPLPCSGPRPFFRSPGPFTVLGHVVRRVGNIPLLFVKPGAYGDLDERLREQGVGLWLSRGPLSIAQRMSRPARTVLAPHVWRVRGPGATLAGMGHVSTAGGDCHSRRACCHTRPASPHMSAGRSTKMSVRVNLSNDPQGMRLEARSLPRATQADLAAMSSKRGGGGWGCLGNLYSRWTTQ